MITKLGSDNFQVAIEWLKNVSNDDLGDFLPQLLEALKNETWYGTLNIILNPSAVYLL